MLAYKKKIQTVMRTTSFCRAIKKNLHVLLLFVAFLLVTIIIQAAIPMNRNAINNEKNTVFAHPWKYSLNGTPFHAVALPSSIDAPAKSCIILKNRLPARMIKGATVLLRTSQQNVAVYVDNVNVYNHYDREKNAPSSAYHFVRMPTDCAAKEIKVLLSSPYASYAGLLSQIYIGSKASNIFFLLRENGVRFSIGFLIFSISFLLIVLFLFIKGQENKVANIYLGAFFACAGYWLIVESKMAQFIFPYPIALTNSSIFALTLLPVFSGLYYYTMHIKLLKKVGKYVITLVAATSFSFSFAICISPTLPLDILPYYLAFMGLYVIAIFTSIIIDHIKAGNFCSASVWGMSTFSICCLCELMFYFTDMRGYNESNFIIVGLLLFCVAMMVDAIQSFARMYQTSVQVNALSILAYTDSLTGFQNRTAFFERLAKINVATNIRVSLFMFDVNNLKIVNDTLGHLVGDKMLQHAAKAIKKTMRQEDELYRIGGDEFVAILFHGQALNLQNFQNSMISVLAEENKNIADYHLNIASGYATFTKNTDKTLFETLARADENMYACKKIQKNRTSF